MFLSLPNPIPREVKDDRDLFDYWKGLRIVPYYGTEQSSSHAMLSLLTTLTGLSPTFRAAMLDLTSYTFGRQIDIVKKTRTGLVSEEQDIEFEEKARFDDYLRSLGIGLVQILKLSAEIDHHLTISGNAYLLVKRIEVEGEVVYKMKVKHYSHCVYVRSLDIAEEFLLISPFIGNQEQLHRYPPKVLRVTQMDDGAIRWTRAEVEGVDEAVIHIRKESYFDDSDYYARPEILGCLPDLFTDYQLSNLSSKIAATEIISKVLLAMQAPDPTTLRAEALESDDGELLEVDENGNIGVKKVKTLFQRNMMTLKELVTNLGHHPSSNYSGNPAASIAGIEVPFGASPPTPIPLEVNRDKEYQEWQKSGSIATICSVMQWSPELLMTRQTKTGLGGNLIYDIFVMKNESTIIPRQRWFEDVWNTVLGWIFDIQATPDELRQYQIQFVDIITEMLEKFSAGKSNLTGVDSAVGNTAPSKMKDDDGSDPTDA